METTDLAWMSLSFITALLLIPGTILFLSNFRKLKNPSDFMLNSWVSTSFSFLIWAIISYSWVFSGDHFGLIGNLDQALLRNFNPSIVTDSSQYLSSLIIMLGQALPLVLGALFILFSALECLPSTFALLLSTAWTLIVFTPLYHWTSSSAGWLYRLGIIDYAAGATLHITVGFSILAISYQQKASFLIPKPKKFYSFTSATQSLLSVSFLMIGWLSLVSGQSLKAKSATFIHCFATTLFSCMSAILIWYLLERIEKGAENTKSSFSPLLLGTLCGLSSIASGAGDVSIQAAVTIGFFCSGSCYFLRKWMPSSDLFCIQGVGGALGAIMSAIFTAPSSIQPHSPLGLILGNITPLYHQIAFVSSLASFSFVMTSIVAFCINYASRKSGVHHTPSTVLHLHETRKNYMKMKKTRLS